MKGLYVLARTFSIIAVTVCYVLVVVMFANLNPKSAAESAAEGIEPPGSLIVHIVWPEGDTDVDLWVDGPGEPAGIGYSNKAGVQWNLLRDDLGNLNDKTPINYEDAFTRGVEEGEYTINVHCYRCLRVPQPVTGTVQMRDPKAGNTKGAGLKTIVNFNAELREQGEEITLVRFRIGADGEPVESSFNRVYKPVRSRPVTPHRSGEQ